jgi:hypothetical protein
MAAPTKPANVKKALANSEPSTQVTLCGLESDIRKSRHWLSL